MSLAGRVSVLAAVVCSFVVSGAHAATNMYLKFEDPSIEGSSTAAGSEKQIEVLSWNHGFTQPTSPTRSSAGAGTVEQANHQNFTFTKYLDTSTNTLLKFCWSGRQIGKVTLTCYRADGANDNKPVPYLKVEMQHVVISNYSISGGPGDIPVENVSLDYGVVKYTYLDQKQAGDAPPSRMTATNAPLLTASAAPSAHAPCTATLAGGKAVDVQSLTVGKSNASFATSGANSAASGPVRLTCGKASVALSGAKLGSANGKVTATGGSMQ